jgi:hypothetical protein
MIPRAEAEQKIRYLATKWAHETNYEPKPGWYPSFGEFCTWLDANKWDSVLNFRSKVGARHDAEAWFEDEIRRHYRRR